MKTLIQNRQWGPLSRIINSLFSLVVLHSKDPGITYYVGAAAPAMRIQGHMYARLMRQSEHFWFVSDGKYGRGYESLTDGQKSLVHRFHRILLRESKLVNVNQDITNRPKIGEIEDGELVVSASEEYLSAVFIGPNGLAPERCLRFIHEDDPSRNQLRGVVLGSRQSISEDNALWEPMMYPVFNPRSQQRFCHRTYFPLTQNSTRSRPMTLVAYLRSVILQEKTFWFSSRLAQQFILDGWSRNEQLMVKYFSSPAFQRKYRASLSRSMGGRHVSTAKIYLPSNFSGTSLYCQRNYHDAQFIAACEGNSHLFITMTANPFWPEILELLPEGQTACDRPDIIARVFRQKVAQLLARLNEPRYLHEAHLGAQWIVYTIEWQQGGLPHIHLAVRLLLDNQVAPMTTTHEQLRLMREMVSAKMPPEGTFEYHLVRTYMIHAHPCLHCVRRRRDGSMGCRFYFPKVSSEYSRVDNKGFPIYERGPGDTWVVPHNMKLLKEFVCHMNVEWTLHSQFIGYLFKYINKGVDSSGVKISHQDNEIAAFRAARVLSVSEAIWRILGYSINYKMPYVVICKIRLPFLRAGDCDRDIAESVMRADDERPFELPPPDFQDEETNSNGYMDDIDENVNQADNSDDPANDMSEIWKDPLTRYFMREKGLDLTYTVFNQWWYMPKGRYEERVPREWRNRDDFYEDVAGNIWKKRVKPILARMPWVPPRFGELHYLRLLLHHMPATSFDDLRGAYRSFRESAIAHGLVAADQEAIYVLKDAMTMGFPGTSLRRLFCSLLTTIEGVCDVWTHDDIRNALRNDFVPSEMRNENWPIHCIDTLCVMDLCVLFSDLEKGDLVPKLSKLNLPMVPINGPELLKISAELPEGFPLIIRFGEIIGVDLQQRVSIPLLEAEIRKYRANANDEYTEEELADRITSLNLGQRVIYQSMMDMFMAQERMTVNVTGHARTLLHVDAPAGCGKTYLCSTFAAYLRRQGHIVLNCAATGIAALNFYFGRTVHSLFQIPIEKDADILDGPQLESSLFEVLRREKKQTNARIELLKASRVIILDEVSMLHRDVLGAVDNLLRAIILTYTLVFGN